MPNDRRKFIQALDQLNEALEACKEVGKLHPLEEKLLKEIQELKADLDKIPDSIFAGNVINACRGFIYKTEQLFCQVAKAPGFIDNLTEEQEWRLYAKSFCMHELKCGVGLMDDKQLQYMRKMYEIANGIYHGTVTSPMEPIIRNHIKQMILLWEIK